MLSGKKRYPNDKAADFREYLSVKGQRIHLEQDSLMYNSCYVDAMKNAVSGKGVPRWVPIHRAKPTLQRHCPLCHACNSENSNNTCQCPETSRWYPHETWSQGFPYQQWEKYFENDGMGSVSLKNRYLCHTHYLTVAKKVKEQCVCCKEATDTKTFIGEDTAILRDYITKDNYTGQINLSLSPYDWCCKECKKKAKDWKRASLKEERIPIVFLEVITDMQKVILENGFIMKRSIMDMLNQKMPPNIAPEDHANLVKQFDSNLTNYIKNGFLKTYAGPTKRGVCYVL